MTNDQKEQILSIYNEPHQLPHDEIIEVMLRVVPDLLGIKTHERDEVLTFINQIQEENQ